MPDGKSLLVSDFSAEAALNIQLGIVSYPEGQFRRLTTDTSAYLYPSVAADGRTIVASQIQEKYQIEIANLSRPDDAHPIPLSSRSTFWNWDWTEDGRIVFAQFPDIRVVRPEGGETVVYSDANRLPDQVVSCGNGRFFVYRGPGRSGKPSFNLWRMSTSGADVKQLTFGFEDADPFCSDDGRWVYYVDIADNQVLKRISLDGGSPETILSPANAITSLSPDGKTLAGYEVRELDHKLTLKLYSIDDKKFFYHDVDQNATWPLKFAPDGKGVVYTVRQKGISNLWLQPLDNSPSRQLTHFTSENIEKIAFSKDGTKIAIERGHSESDAVLLRDAAR
jgi:Tol biopolymer transport system component